MPPPLPLTRRVARGLADRFVAGPWREDDLVDRGGRALGGRQRWLRPLARRLIAAFGEGTRPPVGLVVAFLLADPKLRESWAVDAPILDHRPGAREAPTMWPAPGIPATWAVPPITTPAALADWLGLDLETLDWLADVRCRQPRLPPGPGRHYDHRWVAKRGGSARLVEAPRSRLKAVQRRVLDGIVAMIPPHEAAHGFRPGRSVRTYVEPHVGRYVVLKMDLRDFFPTVGRPRVVAIFRTAGYPEPVAHLLAGLCATSAPLDAWPDAPGPPVGPDAWRARQLYRHPHLPQGAPTSPALANLAAFRLDVRLSGLATAAGARYTRYADDLAFSGGRDFARALDRFGPRVGAIALEEGFVVNPRKTRTMRRGVRQRIAGVVVNDRLNVARDVYDTLKATLFNCARHGPAGQDRAGHLDFRAHLAGRIAHVATLHPERARRLRDLFDRVAW